MGVTEDEAQHLIDSHGVLSSGSDEAGDQELQAAITEAAYGTIDALLQQVQRTLQFVQTQRRHLLPSAVWLMGGGATIPHIGSYLSGKLDMPVRIWSMPAVNTNLAPADGQHSAIFGVSAALSALAWRAA